MNAKLKTTKFRLIFDRIISDVPFFLVDYRVQRCTLIRCMANGSDKKAKKVALCVKTFYCDPEKVPGWLFSGPTNEVTEIALAGYVQVSLNMVGYRKTVTSHVVSYLLVDSLHVDCVIDPQHLGSLSRRFMSNEHNLFAAPQRLGLANHSVRVGN